MSIVTDDGLVIAGLTTVIPTMRVVFDGQSHLLVPNIFGPPAPNIAMEGLGIPWQNKAIGGNSMTRLLNGDIASGGHTHPAATRVFGALNATEFNLMVILGGTTDIHEEFDTAATLMSDMVAYADAARAAGADKVIAGTVPPAVPFTDPEDVQRLAFNSLLLADAGNDFDGTFDVTVPPLDDPTDTDYFVIDQIHWNAAGGVVAGGILQDAILAALP